MINPSNIDLQSLPWLPLEEKAAFPKQAAIYFAIDSLGCVQYIGMAENVHSRWVQHHRYRQLQEIGSIKIAYLFVDTPELLPEIERALIKHFQPLLNRTSTDRLKADLPKKFIQQIKASCSALDINISEATSEAFSLWLEAKKNKVAGILADDD